MEKIEKIVFEAEVGKTGVICRFTKTKTGYLREQIFPNGTVYEGEYTEAEYQQFLHEMKVWEEAVSMSKS
jgi:hypothetical protein